MRQINQTKIFVSAERHDETETENQHRSTDQHAKLENAGYSFRYVDGCYSAAFETAFCVFATPGQILDTIDDVVTLAREFQQDTVLVVHGENAAELVEVNTTCSAITGTFQTVEHPEPGQDCTIADGIYYVVR